jgi:ferredoxin
MALKINDECTACGVCEPECPNEAISEGDPIYLIDPTRCTECVGAYDEPQCASVCPVDACVPDPDNEESKEELLEKYKELHGE